MQLQPTKWLAIYSCHITQSREISLEWCPLTDGHMTMRCLMTKFQVQENEASIALELEYKKLLQKKKKPTSEVAMSRQMLGNDKFNAAHFNVSNGRHIILRLTWI